MKNDESKKVENIYHNFLENINSVNLYYKKFGQIAKEEDTTISEDGDAYTQNVLDIYNKDLSDIEHLEVEDNELFTKERHKLLLKLAKKIHKKPKLSPKNFDILSKGSFIMLNNYFEYLLTDLLTYYHLKFKESLNNKEFKFPFKEINEYENLDEFVENLINKEIENLLIEKTFSQLLDYFKSDLNIPLEEDIIKWKKIEEARERRHLIVHNFSKVNKKYITRTSNPYKYSNGDLIEIDNDYFIDIWNEIKLAGKIICFNCWGSWDKDSIDNAIGEILNRVFENLENRKYETVNKLYKYSVKNVIPKNEIQLNIISRIKINHCIALKKLNNSTELEKVLKTMNFGTSSPIFKIAYQILQDDYTDLEENFKKAILLDELTIDYYLEWPIFDFVREKEEINKRLIKTFEVKNLI